MSYNNVSSKRFARVMAVLLVAMLAISVAVQPVSAASKPSKVKGVKVATKYSARLATFANDKKGYIAPVTVKWNKAKYAKKYQVKYKKVGTKTWTYKTTKKTSYKIIDLNKSSKNLKPNTKYYVKVRALRGSKKGSWSKKIKFTTKPIVDVKPGQITNLVVASKYEPVYNEAMEDYCAPVLLRWNKAANAKSYEVAFTNGKTDWQYMTSNTTSLKVEDFKNADHNLRVYAKYTFKVRAINGKAKGDWSEEIATYTKPIEFEIDFPDMSNALTIKRGLGSLTLNWKIAEPTKRDMTDYSRIKYNIYGSLDTGEDKTWTLIKQVSADTRSYTQRYCEQGVDYFFKVVPADNESYKTFEVEGAESNVVGAQVRQLEGLDIETSYIDKNDEYLWNRSYNLRGLMLQSNRQATESAKEMARIYNEESAHSGSMHAFVDGATGAIVKTLDWDVRAAHALTAGNNRYLSVEICESQYVKYDQEARIESKNEVINGAPIFTVEPEHLKDAKASAKITYNASVKLFAYLCDYFGFDPDKNGAIVSINEWRYKYGNDCGGYGPTHYWYQLGTMYNMDGFRRDVRNLLK